MKKILCVVLTLLIVLSCSSNMARAEETPDFNIDDM